MSCAFRPRVLLGSYLRLLVVQILILVGLVFDLEAPLAPQVVQEKFHL